jgi:hypothetical protein
MGNSEIKRERIRLDESDLINLKKQTIILKDLILSSFDTKSVQEEAWPLRYLTLRSGTEYEFIFSEMGSVTLRLARSDRYRRNPPPIFYISLGKYSIDEYIWEDLNASEINVEKKSLLNHIEESIKIYESSLQ